MKRDSQKLDFPCRAVTAMQCKQCKVSKDQGQVWKHCVTAGVSWVITV